MRQTNNKAFIAKVANKENEAEQALEPQREEMLKQLGEMTVGNQ